MRYLFHVKIYFTLRVFLEKDSFHAVIYFTQRVISRKGRKGAKEGWRFDCSFHAEGTEEQGSLRDEYGFTQRTFRLK